MLRVIVSNNCLRTLPSLRRRSNSHSGTHLPRLPENFRSFFSIAYNNQISQPLCFDIHAKCPGGTPLPNVQTFRHFDLLRCEVCIPHGLAGRSYSQVLCQQHFWNAFHKCCKQKTYGSARYRFKSCRCNTYKKHRGWGVMAD
jgi:hypothetical protein